MKELIMKMEKKRREERKMKVPDGTLGFLPSSKIFPPCLTANQLG
jgi:hypothetical protein